MNTPLSNRTFPLQTKIGLKPAVMHNFTHNQQPPKSSKTAVAFATQHNLPIFILGEGANIFISDAGFAGLVIRPALTTINHTATNADTALVTAGAGVSMTNLIDYCLGHNLLGLEEFSGIPGTVGGSVYINLHYFEFLLAQFLVTAQVYTAPLEL